MTSDSPPTPVSQESSGPPVRPRAGPLPYLAATGLAGVSTAVLVLGVALPAAAAVPVALLFLAVALVVRWLEDLPPGTGGRALSWVAERIRDLGRDYGVEFYGIASITAFLRAEATSLAETELVLDQLLNEPVRSVISWLVTEVFESMVNAVFAVFWWLELSRGVVGSYGISVFAGILAAGWAVWRVLGITPPSDDERMAEFGKKLAEELGSLTDELGG